LVGIIVTAPDQRRGLCRKYRVLWKCGKVCPLQLGSYK